MGRSSWLQLWERYALYTQGLTDDEIAAALGTTRKAVARWRQRRKLKANRVGDHESRKRMELYEIGLTDQEIAEKLHYSVGTIKQWRRRHNLPPNE